MDCTLQRLMYSATEPFWPLGKTFPALFFYYGAPVLVGIIAVAAVAVLVAGSLSQRWRKFRIAGLYVLLCGLLGPGLLVNLISKDYSGRPRPRQVEAFGGHYAYHRVFELGKPGQGKSFPAGHASTGFLLCTGYFLLKRRRPQWAFGVLVFSVLLGAGMGWCRMAAGAHFFSDVVFAWVMTFSTCMLVYYVVLRIPDREQASPEEVSALSPQRRKREVAFILAGLVAIGGVLLLAYPHHQNYDLRVPLESVPRLSIQVERGDLTLDFTRPELHGQVTGDVRSFGLPKSRLHPEWKQDSGQTALRVYAKGLFTEVEGGFTVFIDPSRLTDLEVQVLRGSLFTVPERVPESLRLTELKQE